MKLFLIGMPGSGKSTTAREIADLKNIAFYDTDDLIQTKYQMTIPEIFRKSGEKEFRKFERIVLEEIILKDNFIVATGGGLPCFNDNMNKMNNTGITVYLKTSIDILVQRIRLSVDRPLLLGKSDKELADYLIKLSKYRKPFYLQAKYIIDADQNRKKFLKSEPFYL